MAILFSEVSMRDDYSTAVFFVRGFPAEPDDLDGVEEFHAFLDEMIEDALVNIYATAYRYGEGKPIRATPKELADIKLQIAREPGFLAEKCVCMGEADFNLMWHVDAGFDQYFEEQQRR